VFLNGANVRGMMLLLVVVTLSVSVHCSNLVQVNAGEFPIGLTVEYDVSFHTFRGTETFEVLSWATGSGSKSVQVRLTKTSGGSTTTETLTVDLTTWDSTLVVPPILTNVSGWHAGEATAIPTRWGTFDLSMTSIGVPEGTYSSWLASYWDIDDISWTSESDVIYYEQVLGVLLSWRYSHHPTQPSNWVEYSAVLLHSNLAQFGRLSAEAMAVTAMMLLLVIACPFVACIALAVIAGNRLKPRQSTSSQVSRLSEDRATSQPLPATNQPPVGQEIHVEEASLAPPACGRPEQCVVCSHDLSSREAVLACPHCGARAHRSHFLEWAKIKRSCPQCHETLEQTDFQ